MSVALYSKGFHSCAASRPVCAAGTPRSVRLVRSFITDSNRLTARSDVTEECLVFRMHVLCALWVCGVGGCVLHVA